MKKILIGAAMLCMALGCSAEMKQALTLYMESGTTLVYFLDTEPEIGFEGQTMLVRIGGSDADEIPMEDVDRWEIGMAESLGVSQAEMPEQVRITIGGGAVSVINPEGGAVRVYGIGGQLVGSSQAEESTFALEKGVYVVTVSNKSYKIAIR